MSKHLLQGLGQTSVTVCTKPRPSKEEIRETEGEMITRNTTRRAFAIPDIQGLLGPALSIGPWSGQQSVPSARGGREEAKPSFELTFLRGG